MGAASISTAVPGYVVAYSCRFDVAVASYLLIAPSEVAAARQTYTLSAWIKRGNLGKIQNALGCSNAAGSIFSYALMASNTPTDQMGTSNSSTGSVTVNLYQTNWYIRDPSAWYHLMLSVDTTKADEDSRVRLFYNGILVTGYTTDTQPSLNSSMQMNRSGITIGVGRLGDFASASEQFDGYLSQVAMVSELALEPTDFGEFDSYGVWRPIDITELDYSGANSFLLDFADSSALGNDVSGEDNDLTSTGLASDDQVIDTPTKNYPTFASNMGRNFASAGDASTLTNGNLDIVGAESAVSICDVNFAPLDSGKWYFTWIHDARNNMNNDMGITNDLNRAIQNGTASGGYTGDAGAVLVGLEGSNQMSVQSADFTNITATFPVTSTTSDQTVMAVDIDNLKLWAGFWDASEDDLYWLANDGSWSSANVDVPGTGSSETCAITGTGFTFFSQNYATRGGSVDFGSINGGILGNITTPSGFKEVNTSNLPAPTVRDGTAKFQTTLYTGNGSVRNIDQTENSTFQPDFVWIKNRSAADDHMAIDAARGVTKQINPDGSDVEVINANGLTSFDSDGFGLGTGAGGYNDDTESFVAWQWLAGGGAGSSNTDGSINTTTTTVSTTAGISIGTYTGTGSNATIGHGLGVAPDMVIVKCRNDGTGAGQGHWYVYHRMQSGNPFDPQTDYTLLNTNAGKADDATVWQDTAPTSTVFSIGTAVGVNESSNTYIYYAFADVQGFSKMGGYKGNGAAEGPLAFTGFKTAFVMIKRADDTGNWIMYDNQRSPYNEIDDQLFADTTAAETTGSEEIDFLANGFKIRTADAIINAVNGTYFYMSFGEYPFGGDGASPATAF